MQPLNKAISPEEIREIDERARASIALLRCRIYAFHTCGNTAVLNYYSASDR